MVYRVHQNEDFDSVSVCAEFLSQIWPRIHETYQDFIRKNPDEWAGFEKRLNHYLPKLLQLYFDLYSGCIDAYPVFFELIECLVADWVKRPCALKGLDREREQNPAWFCSNQMVGAVCYVDLFAGDLKKLRGKLPYLKELGINYLHLMPIFKAPKGENDGGYAVSSYREVSENIGTAEDLESLAELFHCEGIVLVADFVFNHTSDEHEWALKAKAGEEKYRNFYWMFDDRTVPDQYERNLREIFPDEHPGAFTWFPDIQKWVWTTFHSYQWDLNYHNPRVLIAMADEMLSLSNMGVDVLRLDAVAFIWKRMGTVCESLPQAYELVKVFNLIARISAPSLLFKSEAIVHPDEVIRYIDPELCQLSYNPLLMALMWESLATRETKLLTKSMRKRFALPSQTAWVNYVRCHDDIGWTFSDEDAASVGINGFPHRQFLNQFYTGRFPGSFARGLPFQENPRTGDCRISGSMASLAGVEKSLAENDERELSYSLDRMTILFGITMFIGGIPLIYVGDEIAALNDYSYRDDPKKAEDSRWVHRSQYDWEKREHCSYADTLWLRVKKLIEIRKTNPVFSVQRIEVPPEIDPHVFRFIKRRGDELIMVIANFSEHHLDLPVETLDGFHGSSVDLLTEKSFPKKPLSLEPYQLLCLYGKA